MRSAQERWPSTDRSDPFRETLGLLPPEARVLLLSAGGEEADPSLRVLLQQQINWPRLCGLAEREHASAILWARLTRLGFEPGPQSALLQRLGMVSEFRLGQLQRRLYQTTDALAAAGIKVVLLKGAAIAHTAYASFAQRPMGDIDLLVRSDQAAAAGNVLRATGWIRSPFGDDYAFEGHQHLPPFADTRGSGAGLDLHTDLLFEGHPFRFSPDAVRDRAQRVRSGTHEFLVPDLLHQLLHACIHFAYSHVMAQAAWRTFRDIAAIAATGRIDWNQFVRLARESGGETSSYWTFQLARAAAGVSVPAHVIADLRPSLPQPVLRLLQRHFTLGLLPTDSSCPSVRLRNLLWRAGLFPEWSNRGPVRPWGRLRRFHTSSQGAGGMLKGLPRHLRHAAASPRYVWGVLRGSPPP